MGNPRDVRPDEVEIIVGRELRKAGLGLSRPRVISRQTISDDEPGTFRMTLGARLEANGSDQPVDVEFWNQTAPMAPEAVRAFAESAAGPPAEDRPKRLSPAPAASGVSIGRPLRVMFSTSGYEPAAVASASALGVALLAVADGRVAFNRSQWAMGDQPPAWVPEYMAEIVGMQPDGSVRHDLVVLGMAPRILASARHSTA